MRLSAPCLRIFLGANTGVHTIFIFVISLGAYSAGGVLARKRERGASSAVYPLEALLAGIGLLTVVVFRRSVHGFVIAAIIAAMLALGAAFSYLLRKGSHVAGGTREYEETVQSGAVSLWKRWVNASRAVVDFEFRLFLVAIYWLLIGPFAVVFRYLRSERPNSDSAWLPKQEIEGFDAARRPF